MTLEEALNVAYQHDACDDELHEIERCGTWAEVLSHPDALFWVRWFADYLPADLHPARDAFRTAMWEARKELTGTYNSAKAWKFDATKKVASGALLAEIKKFLEIEEPQQDEACGSSAWLVCYQR